MWGGSNDHSALTNLSSVLVTTSGVHPRLFLTSYPDVLCPTQGGSSILLLLDIKISYVSIWCSGTGSSFSLLWSMQACNRCIYNQIGHMDVLMLTSCEFVNASVMAILTFNTAEVCRWDAAFCKSSPTLSSQLECTRTGCAMYSEIRPPLGPCCQSVLFTEVASFQRWICTIKCTLELFRVA